MNRSVDHAVGHGQGWAIQTSDAGYVAFSPDGKSLFGAALDGSGRVTVWDVAIGEIPFDGQGVEGGAGVEGKPDE